MFSPWGGEREARDGDQADDAAGEAPRGAGGDVLVSGAEGCDPGAVAVGDENGGVTCVEEGERRCV